MLDNPLLDWLDRHGAAKGFVPDDIDPDIDFLRFVSRKGQEFEAAVLAHFRDSGVGEIVTIGDGVKENVARSPIAASETFEAMRQGAPIIYQGVLHNPINRTYGVPDLLMRSDTLSRLFPGTLATMEDSFPALALDLGCHYVVVEIKYSTLSLLAQGGLGNSGSFPAYKVQLYLYNAALAQLQKYLPPRAFVLGRGWKQTVKGTAKSSNNCINRLAPVGYDDIIKGKTLAAHADEACQWIRLMRSEGASWDALPEPSNGELRPHAKGQHGSWAEAVKRIIVETEDLTALWYVSPSARRAANEAGITRWTDERATPKTLGVTGAKTAPVLAKILEVNRSQNGPVIQPPRVEVGREQWHPLPELEFYIDTETVNEQDDDFSAFPFRGGSALIFMVGCGHIENSEWVFKTFTVDALSPEAEASMLEAWFEHMDSVVSQLAPASPPVLIHWASHEATTLRDAYQRHEAKSSSWPELRWFDFLTRVMRPEPVVVKGALDFSLKSVGSALQKAGAITTERTTVAQDGLQAMVGAWSCQHLVDDGTFDQLIDVPLMSEIRDYNEDDCYVMHEIVSYLRHNH